MQLPRKRTAAALTAAGGVVAAGVAGFALLASPAQAEDPTPSGSAAAPAPSGSAAAPAAPQGRPGGGPDRAARQEELAAALAKELGIDQSKVAAALEKVQADQQKAAKADRIAELKTKLDAAVKAGTLTADESAAILKAAEAGVLPGGVGGPGGRGGHGPR